MALFRTDPKLRSLAAVPLFAGCSRAELRAIAGLLDEVDVTAGTELTREGERGLEFFVIVEGYAVAEADGRALGSLTAGDVVGELALLADQPRTATVTAHTAMRLLVGDRRAFDPLLERFPEVRQRILASATQRERSNAA